MPLKDVVKVSRKTFFNPTGWLGYEQLKANTASMWDIIKGTFSPAKPTVTETFAEAMQRLNLTEDNVKRIAQNYQAYSYFFLFLAVCSVIGAFYLLIVDFSIAGWILAIATAGLFGVQAFRYSFWLFQMKHRKLGCTFAEWRSGKIIDEAGPQS